MRLFYLVMFVSVCSLISAQNNVGINTDTIEGRLHISAQSTTAFPQLRLTETEDDYARIKFESTAFPNSFWDIAARGGTDTTGVKRFNLYFHNGVTGRDLFLMQGNGDLYRNSFDESTIDYFFTDNSYRGGLGFTDNNEFRIFAFDASDRIAIGTRMRRDLVIDTIGRIGIGTTEPDFKLDIRSDAPNSDAIMRLANSDISNHLTFFPGRSGDPNPFIQWSDGSPIRFATDGGMFGYDEKVRITSSGNVGICTDNPLEKLHVAGNTLIEGEKTIELPWDEGSFTVRDSFGYQLAMDGNDIQSYNDGAFADDTLFIQREGGFLDMANGGLSIDRSFYPPTVQVKSFLRVENDLGSGFQPVISLHDYLTTGSPGLSLAVSSGHATIFNRATGYDIKFGTNNTVRMELKSNGDLKLLGGRFYPTNQEFMEDGGDFHLMLNGGLSSNLDNTDDLGTASLRWQDIYATNGTIQTSDVRDKTAIRPIDYGLNTLMALEPVVYQWKTQPEAGDKLGLIAQDVQELIPEVVKSTDFVRTADGTTQEVELERLGMYYSDLIPVLIKSIQEQQAMIIELQAQVAELNAAND